jgi:GntR family transcriptional regulator, transcriptional repressor for pyruvate dehydrogenase complex
MRLSPTLRWVLTADMSTTGPFRRLRPARALSDELITHLAARIMSGEWQPSDKMPTEQEMIAEFGVSRTVVREAIAALKAEGLVQTRQGAGAFVSSDMRLRPFRIDAADMQDIENVLDIMQLRMTIEIEAAGLAAQRGDPASRTEIERSLGAFAAEIAAGSAAVDADFQFHIAVSRATGNDYFARFLEFLGHHIIPRQSIRVEATGPEEQVKYLERVLREHRSIFEAIAAGSADKARRAMRTHLSNGRNRYLTFANRATG